jgi:hypothetical protein
MIMRSLFGITLKDIFNNQKVEYPDPKDKKKRKNKNKGQNKGEKKILIVAATK